MDTGKLPTPEKIARQRASAQMPKCKCGGADGIAPVEGL